MSARAAILRCEMPATPASAMSSSVVSMMRSRRPGSLRRALTGGPSSDAADDTSRVAHRKAVGGDVTGDDRAGPDHAVLANRHARTDDGASAEPDVVGDRDGLGRLELVAPGLRVDGVRRGQQLHVRADLAVGPDADLRDVQRDEPPVDEGPGADEHAAAVVDVDRRAHEGALFHPPEELTRHSLSRFGILVVRGEEPRSQLHGFLLCLEDGWVVGDVQVARKHPLVVAAGVAGEIVDGRGCGLRHADDRTYALY